MRKVNLLSMLLALLLSLTFYSCDYNVDVVDPENIGKNFPVIVNTLNTYTFTVDADNFSITRNESLSFDSDSLTITLVLSSYSSGSGTIQVKNQLNEMIFSENLNSNKVVTLPSVIGNIPKSNSITISNLKGKISFVLTKKK